MKKIRFYQESDTIGNKSRPCVSFGPQTETHKHCQKREEKSTEIIALKDQIKEKEILLKDVLMNESTQERYEADTKAKLKEERQVSAQLRSEVSRTQTGMRQLQQELAHYKRQCE